ncbi:AraC-type DNA-binding protein [Anaerosporobacter mobilis DSM 15930]|jgi:AraC-like DNA-binding protein|uniref:AraC-type DNA-binding protein n=1 Tax=Anaerosporobacter mobilis DSM 15930 TaxID=1120996 RepID=A0A1M7FAP4_9FIRM|nr:AraC family transcriptional regulator [Anaerosporobacter mobilis]SHM01080.1 AraC-type DNA-binding protein [Anaerosporobacter mobilis DSM 15930]
MKTLYEKIDMINSPFEAFYVTKENFIEKIAAHWHYFVEIMYLVSGTVQVNCDNIDHHLNAGDLIFFHPGSIHSIYNPSDDMHYAIIKLNLSSLHTIGDHFLKPVAIIRTAKGNEKAPIHVQQEELKALPIADWFKRCITELSKKAYGYDISFYSTVSNILIEIIRIWKQHGFVVEQTSPAAPNIGTIQTITEYIDEHSQQPLRVDELAHMCDMSYSYFAKNFQLLYGQSCKEYIASIRIRKAKDLLIYTDLDQNYISQDTGFSDCSHFIRVFKQKEGITPKQFRIKHITHQ